MGLLNDDVVTIRQPERDDDPKSVITVNCPDKTGLGCDLCRLILFFGLTIVRVDVSTDGKWCYIVFWVIGKPSTRWGLLKKRLIGVCPSCSSASGISFYQSELQPPKPPDVFLLKLCCYDRKGLLHDVTVVLCELELTIKRVKVSTTPDGRVMDLFFITDTRELLHTNTRQEDTCDCLKSVLGDVMISCSILIAGPETVCSQGHSFLPPAIMEDKFDDEHGSGSHTSNNVSVTLDNSLSPAHTLVQIVCEDHKGLLYDIMRTFKDYNIQILCGTMPKSHAALSKSIFRANSFKELVDICISSYRLVSLEGCCMENSLMDLRTWKPQETSLDILGPFTAMISYGRGTTKQKRKCEVDLFIMQADGKKIVDPIKQSALCSRIQMELRRPLRVTLVTRGPDTELLVANPVEVSGKGRPLVFYDITLALKMLNTGIFSAEIGRHTIGDKEWEVYRILLDEVDRSPVLKSQIEGAVWKMLKGWE